VCCNEGGAPAPKVHALSKLKATPIGERLDRFELIAELASGGMATVYLGRLGGVAGFQRFVAIKRLHPHLAREGEFVDMFLDEARLAARIHHPNVVPILEIGESPEGYYLVMEYIEGDTAARLLARSTQTGHRLPAPIALRIVLDALTGLHAAHELKDDNRRSLELVHRDVSPQNVLVGVDGVTRITDFGVARAATRLSTTRSGQLKGKLAYMAPEQARGGQIDRRADIFSMGAVMWEMLAAKRLFKGEGEAETLNRVLFEPIPSLRIFEPSTPPPIEQICMYALARDANHRFATAIDMADALEKTARSLHCLASTRDVATYVDAIIGQEISQQREAVRAWLARSEPSRNDRVPVPSGPLLPGSTGSYPRADSRPSAPPPVPPGVGDSMSPGAPSTVSAVSSAVIHPRGPSGTALHPSSFPPRAPEGSSASAPRRTSRAGFWWTVPLAIATAGGVALVYPRVSSRGAAGASSAPIDVRTSSEPPAASAATPPPPATQPAPAIPSASAAAANVDAEPQTTTAAATAPTVTTTKPVRPVRPVTPRPGTKTSTVPGQPATTSDDPDDISRNPYR
jgi:serine/threonine protein kinase